MGHLPLEICFVKKKTQRKTNTYFKCTYTKLLFAILLNHAGPPPSDCLLVEEWLGCIPFLVRNNALFWQHVNIALMRHLFWCHEVMQVKLNGTYDRERTKPQSLSSTGSALTWQWGNKFWNYTGLKIRRLSSLTQVVVQWKFVIVPYLNDQLGWYSKLSLIKTPKVFLSEIKMHLKKEKHCMKRGYSNVFIFKFHFQWHNFTFLETRHSCSAGR